MARIRTIKPEFWESESVGRLSLGARLLFIASLNFADDEGLLRWNEAYLSSQAFIYDELLSEQLSEWMRELVSESLIFPYKAGLSNQRLAWIINFRNHQVINRPQPAKLPPPSIQNADYRNTIIVRDKHICHLCGGLIIETEQLNTVGSLAPSIDHVIPQSKGGTDYPSNLKAAHISCNKSKKDNSVNHSVNHSLPERKGKEGKDNTLSGKPDPVPPKTKKPKLNGAECSEVLDYLNEKAGSKFRPVDASLKLIQARFNEGATLDEIKQVIDAKTAEWKPDPKMAKFLRPGTLFNPTKYAQYAGQLGTAGDSGLGHYI